MLCPRPGPHSPHPVLGLFLSYFRDLGWKTLVFDLRKVPSTLTRAMVFIMAHLIPLAKESVIPGYEFELWWSFRDGDTGSEALVSGNRGPFRLPN